MGLYTVPCSKCGQEFLWFSGHVNDGQVCVECVSALSTLPPVEYEARGEFKADSPFVFDTTTPSFTWIHQNMKTGDIFSIMVNDQGFHVNGNKVAEDIELYHAFKRFFSLHENTP